MLFQIYGKDNCRYCFQAVALLRQYGLQYQEFKLGKEFTRDELLELFPEAKTFPQIRLKHGIGQHTYIGGFDQLQEYLKSNAR